MRAAYDERGQVIETTTWSRPGIAHVMRSDTWEAENVSVSIDDEGRASYSLQSIDGLRSRQVAERTPGAISALLTGDRAAQAAQLWALAMPTANDPGYTLSESTFDVAGQVLASVDASGARSAPQYDAQGRMTGEVMIGADGARTQTGYQYDAQGNRTAVIHPSSFDAGSFGLQRTVTAYTGRNLVAQQVEEFVPANGSAQPASSLTTTYTYTATGRKASETDPRDPSLITTYQYGVCCDRLTGMTDAKGFQTTYTYDAEGRLTSTTDANGVITGTTYDAHGRAVTTTDGLGSTTATTYDDNLTDGIGLDADYAELITPLGFAPGAAGSAQLLTSATGERTLVIQDSQGRTIRRVMRIQP